MGKYDGNKCFCIIELHYLFECKLNRIDVVSQNCFDQLSNNQMAKVLELVGSGLVEGFFQ